MPRILSTPDIQGQIQELYGLKVSPELASAVTDAVLDEVAAWQSRPLEPSYAIVFFDALRVKIRDERLVRNKAGHLAIGMRLSGHRQVLGIWSEQTEDAKFWLRAMTELKARGTYDLMIAAVDGLPGFQEVTTEVFPETVVQSCIVHLHRFLLQFASWKERKPLGAAIPRSLRGTSPASKTSWIGC